MLLCPIPAPVQIADIGCRCACAFGGRRQAAGRRAAFACACACPCTCTCAPCACPCTCTCAACAACASTRAAFLVPPNSWQPRDTTSARTCTCTPDMIQTILDQAYLFVRQRARQELVGCNSSGNPVQWLFMWQAMPPDYQRHPIQAGKKSGPVVFQWARSRSGDLALHAT